MKVKDLLERLKSYPLDSDIEYAEMIGEGYESHTEYVHLKQEDISYELKLDGKGKKVVRIG